MTAAGWINYFFFCPTFSFIKIKCLSMKYYIKVMYLPLCKLCIYIYLLYLYIMCRTCDSCTHNKTTFKWDMNKIIIVRKWWIPTYFFYSRTKKKLHSNFFHVFITLFSVSLHLISITCKLMYIPTYIFFLMPFLQVNTIFITRIKKKNYNPPTLKTNKYVCGGYGATVYKSVETLYIWRILLM